MTLTNISDIAGLDNKFPISKLQVRIKKAFKPNEKDGQGGKKGWRMQAVILEDDSGEIRGTFWNRYDLDFRNMENEDLIITRGEDKRGNPAGITAEDYNGKREVKISEQATLDWVGSEPVGDTPYNDDRKDVVKPDSVKTETVKETPKWMVAEGVKRESIERQVALKKAVDLAAAVGVADTEPILKQAEEFYKFLCHSDRVI